MVAWQTTFSPNQIRLRGIKDILTCSYQVRQYRDRRNVAIWLATMRAKCIRSALFGRGTVTANKREIGILVNDVEVSYRLFTITMSDWRILDSQSIGGTL